MFNLTAEESEALQLLQSNTYEQVSKMIGKSRGWIWRLATRCRARKTELRINQRQKERRQAQMETLQSMINTTIKADVLDFLEEIPDDSLSLYVTSFPYNIGKSYGSAPAADAMRFAYYHGWIMMVISEMSRTLKPGGVACINVGKTVDWTHQLMPLDVLIYEDLRRAGLTFQNRVIWTMPHGLTPTKRLAGRYETILIFSKGEQATFNPNVARMPQKNPAKRAYKGPNKGEISSHPFGAFPTDVWNDIPTIRHNHPERAMGDHPAQYPVMLAKRAILLYTLPGDLVCDPFSGSGTTCVAAIESGRDFIGADLFYEELRAKRIGAAQPDTVSALPGVSDSSVEIWKAEAVKKEATAMKRTKSDQEQLFELY